MENRTFLAPFRVYLTLTESYDIIYRKFIGNFIFDDNIGMGYEERHDFPEHAYIWA